MSALAAFLWAASVGGLSIFERFASAMSEVATLAKWRPTSRTSDYRGRSEVTGDCQNGDPKRTLTEIFKRLVTLMDRSDTNRRFMLALLELFMLALFYAADLTRT